MNMCNFCGRSNMEAGVLVEGSALEDENVFICRECSKQCMETIDNSIHDETTSPEFRLGEIPTPNELSSHLDQYVIGQKRAKRQLSVEVSGHYQRLLDCQEGTNLVTDIELQDVVIEKSNIMLIGPTGCGKTLLAKSLANKLNVPFAIGDATTLTEAGYVGEDVENLLLRLLNAADMDVTAAEKGIIYIDEIDKIRSTGGNVSITRDVSGQGVQQSLLKMIEGTVCNVPPQGGRKHPEQNYIQIDTTNILFIVGGAFVGLEDIIRRRTNKQSLGFGNATIPKSDRESHNEILAQVRQEDLVEFGMIPEFVGRLPILATLEELSVEDLVKVLDEPKNALLKQERKKMLLRGVELEFTTEAKHKIAEIAIEKGMGARALRSVVTDFMTDIYFDLPRGHKDKLVIDLDVVMGKKHLFRDHKEAA